MHAHVYDVKPTVKTVLCLKQAIKTKKKEQTVLMNIIYFIVQHITDVFPI